MKITNGWLRGTQIALLVAGLGACRTDDMTDSGGNGTDAADRVTPTDTRGTDVQMGNDVQMGDDVQFTDATDAPTPTDGGGGGDSGARMLTIAQIQNIADPMHPMPGTHVALTQSGMVALTGRTLIGSRNGDSMGRCRLALWVGSGMTGDFSGVLVEELIPRGDAGDCFSVTGHIPSTIAPGASIISIDNSTYDEFCAGPVGQDMTMCRNFEQTELFAPHTITVGATGTAPAATSTTLAEIGQAPGDAGVPGARALNLEGVLVTTTGHLNVTNTTNDAGTFSTFTLADMTDPTKSVEILVSNFSHTSCVRTFLNAQNNMNITVTGILLPDFGRWKIRLRDENDIQGIGSCTADAGAGLDGG